VIRSPEAHAMQTPNPAPPAAGGSSGRAGRVTLALAGLTLLVLFLSVPGALRDAFDRGGVYLFSRAFLEDLPKRLTGPGRFRFILQPLVATLLGIRSGMADARAGRPPYLLGLVTDRQHRGELVRDGLASVANLLLMGVLLDSIFQWVILGSSYPGAALVVGPVLIATPYAVARALSNRVARVGKSPR
jgi:hypothetical protein